MRTILKLMVTASVTTALSSAAASAALVASYQMESPNPLANSVGASTYRPDMVNGTNAPDQSPTGGVGDSGSLQFDASNSEYLTFGAGYLFLGYRNEITPLPSDPQNHDYTFSFWIKTTDASSNTGGYPGTPQLPILGDVSEQVSFSIGVDGGTASYRYHNAGWHVVAGNTSVADGLGHYVTIVAHHSATPNIDIYVDGAPDVIGAPVSLPGQLDSQVGRSYGPHYGSFTLDDMRLYDTALSASEVHDLFAPVPEPVSLALLAAPVSIVIRRPRRRA